MASGFSTKASIYATALFATFAGAVAPARFCERNAQAAVRLHGDSDSEVRLGPPSRLPLFGPLYAPITIDLFVPFGHRYTVQTITSLVRLGRENPDVRLLFHPVLGGETADRGAEALFALWQQAQTQPGGGERCFAFAETLASHLEYLANDAEAEAQLLQAGRTAGVDAQLFLRAIKRHSQRALLSEIWQSERAEVRTPPEVWVNGRRLRGLTSDAGLREELERQRARAYQALRSGTPLTELYEQLASRERGDISTILSGFPRSAPPLSAPLGLRSPFSPPPGPVGVLGGLGLSGPPGFGGGAGGFLSVRMPQPVARNGTPHLDIAGSPRRGPDVSPVTVVMIGSLDSYSTFNMVRSVVEAWSHHSESVRLVFQHAPSTDQGRKVAQLLGQLGLLDPDAFWRVFDGIRDLMPKRYVLRYADLIELMRRQRVDVGQLEAMIRDPREGDAVHKLLQRDAEQAQRLGITTQATVLVNGRPLSSGSLYGPALAEAVTRRIESELKRGLLSRLSTP